VTLNAALVVPELPSFTETSLIEIVGLADEVTRKFATVDRLLFRLCVASAVAAFPITSPKYVFSGFEKYNNLEQRTPLATH
jgi:hypothetical protein